jgi:hypothetical protein
VCHTLPGVSLTHGSRRGGALPALQAAASTIQAAPTATCLHSMQAVVLFVALRQRSCVCPLPKHVQPSAACVGAHVAARHCYCQCCMQGLCGAWLDSSAAGGARSASGCGWVGARWMWREACAVCEPLLLGGAHPCLEFQPAEVQRQHAPALSVQRLLWAQGRVCGGSQGSRRGRCWARWWASRGTWGTRVTQNRMESSWGGGGGGGAPYPLPWGVGGVVWFGLQHMWRFVCFVLRLCKAGSRVCLRPVCAGGPPLASACTACCYSGTAVNPPGWLCLQQLVVPPLVLWLGECPAPPTLHRWRVEGVRFFGLQYTHTHLVLTRHHCACAAAGVSLLPIRQTLAVHPPPRHKGLVLTVRGLGGHGRRASVGFGGGVVWCGWSGCRACCTRCVGVLGGGWYVCAR